MITAFRVYHTSVSWWFLTEVWVTSLLKSPGLYSVFWSISAISTRPVISKSSSPGTNPLTLIASFSQRFELVGFPWNLSNSKSLHVSKTLLRILADLNNAVVEIVLILLPLLSNFSMFFFFVDRTDPSAPFIINIIITFLLPNFSNSLAKSLNLSFYFLSFLLYSPLEQQNLQVLFFLLITSRSGLLLGIRWSFCILKTENMSSLIFLDRFWLEHIQYLNDI